MLFPICVALAAIDAPRMGPVWVPQRGRPAGSRGGAAVPVRAMGQIAAHCLLDRDPARVLELVTAAAVDHRMVLPPRSPRTAKDVKRKFTCQ